METVLVVDDEKNYLVVLSELLGEEGYEVICAENGPAALSFLEESDVDLVITDMKMPKMSGIRLLEEVKRRDPSLPVIMMTAYGTVENAVEAMKKGALDYITKPFQNEELKMTVRKAVDHHLLVRRHRMLAGELAERLGPHNIIGKSAPLQRIFALIAKVAQTKATVLITGESGTGKELVAKAMHFGSPRRDAPFVSVNCSALAETLLESELFGHERGSFTGAVASRKGRFELADGGTLFLDEVGEMSAALQVKLLRVLQEREFERVGGTRTLKMDVRVVAASNRDLKRSVAEGLFREDLFYRLNVVRLQLPPLRERSEDIPLLAAHFAANCGKELGKPRLTISPEAMELLVGYSWPGNVRELENAVERAAILCQADLIRASDLPEELRGGQRPQNMLADLYDLPLPEALERLEAGMIKRALRSYGYVQAQAAKALGITKSLLQYKIKKYDLHEWRAERDQDF
ncbi:MAG: sigma-54 dependent transcriptional regulator [Pseudomonadota bacterium]